MQNVIRYTGLNNLSDEEKSTLKNIMENHFPKTERMIKNQWDLIVAVKTQKKTGRKRFSISLRLETPATNLVVNTKDTERGGDWDLTKAAHKSLNALYFEVKHKFKPDTQQWKKGGIKKFLSRP